MRVSTAVVGLLGFSGSAFAAVYDGESTAPSYGAVYTPVQQINDGQIQNPESCGIPVPVPSSSTPLVPSTSGSSTLVPSPPVPSPPVLSPPVPSPPVQVPPVSQSNLTAVFTPPNITTASVFNVFTPVTPQISTSRPPVAVQTGAANGIFGSTASLGFAGLIVALLA
ncbi:uncharacterized protein PV09_01821 [Verruconis gallopava]|uniref:Uncharacterized protein n=1 Tax=Verruconis gallopava TaxID=253628 RepID=A0A0D1Z4L8_9PEZI|nr:uncharacterized protein PV09_01821 [Verruconis gallopava]KIW07912.1 hypothetical protein PV09_01821 [Verruconis gallopava]